MIIYREDREEITKKVYPDFHRIFENSPGSAGAPGTKPQHRDYAFTCLRRNFSAPMATSLRVFLSWRLTKAATPAFVRFLVIHRPGTRDNQTRQFSLSAKLAATSRHELKREPVTWLATFLSYSATRRTTRAGRLQARGKARFVPS